MYTREKYYIMYTSLEFFWTINEDKYYENHKKIYRQGTRRG